MEQKNYHNSITAAVTPAQAFAGIANVGAWWAKSFKGRAMNPGDKFTVQFGETKVDFEITEAIPEKRVVWHVTDCYLPWLNNKTEWTGTSVEWDISSNAGATQIDMTHIGLFPGVECYEDCKTGWNGHITGSLHNLLTKGAGQPQ